MSGDLHNPCHLEGQFSLFREELRISQEAQRGAQVEQTKILQAIATQTANIGQHGRDIEDLKGRTRDLELKPAKSANKVFWMLFSTGLSIASAITVGITMAHVG